MFNDMQETTAENFPAWFATMSGTKENEVQKILDNDFALHFLIAWSLFESKCLSGFAKADGLKKFALKVSTDSLWSAVGEIARHFHSRYQDSEIWKNLVHKEKRDDVLQLIGRSFDDLKQHEGIYVLLFVIYRYRNNMFHGNKGAGSWLRYRKQIELCTRAMQEIMSVSLSPLSEKAVPSSKVPTL